MKGSPSYTPYIIGIIGLILTLSVWQLFRNNIYKHEEEIVNRVLEQVTHGIKDRLDDYKDIHYSGANNKSYINERYPGIDKMNFQNGWSYESLETIRNFINGLFETHFLVLKDKIGIEIQQIKGNNTKKIIYKKILDTNEKIKCRSGALRLYHEKWLVKITVPSNFYKTTNNEAEIILGLGLLLNLLLFILTNSLTKRKHEALKLAARITKELQEKNNTLEKRNQELDAFAYIASHDLKEPLRTVHSYIGLLEKHLNKKMFVTEDSKEKIFFEYIKIGCQTMTNLIDDLLEFSRVGKEEIIEDIDTKKLLESTLRELDHDIKISKAKIIYSDLPTIQGNPSDIKRVFQNLIANSLKYKNPKNNPIIEISHQSTAKNSHEFIIKDNGIGISPEYKEQIFTAFRRLHTKEEYPGTGIGLAICKKAVENHKGAIWVESELGEGSRFHFTLNCKND